MTAAQNTPVDAPRRTVISIDAMGGDRGAIWHVRPFQQDCAQPAREEARPSIGDAAATAGGVTKNVGERSPLTPLCCRPLSRRADR